MSTRCSFKRLLGAFLVGAAFSLAGSTPAFADDPSATGLFELDANVTLDHSGTGLPDDWIEFPLAPPPGTGTSHAEASTGIVTDSNPLVFSQGSKDINDISTWAWRAGSSPPKADIQHAYAAAYVNSDNHLVIYFGSDRAVNTGTVATGFWFFKNAISVNANGTFNGVHANGDVLVAAQYDNGGHVGTIAVYEWNNGGLQTVAVQSNTSNFPGIFCDAALGGVNNVCGITNGSTTDIPWYTLTGQNGAAPPGTFFEGGIDITALIPGAQCFASFMATSRSSTTTTAEIKNFVLSAFPVCGINVTKACTGATVNSTGTAVDTTFNVVVKNTGVGTVYNVSLAEDSSVAATCTITSIDGAANSTPLGTTPVQVGASLAGGATTTVGLTCEGSANGLVNKIHASAASSQSLASNDLTADATSNVCQATVTPGLQVLKACDTSKPVQLSANGTLTFQVCNDFTITNTGNETLNNVTVTDTEFVNGASANVNIVSGISLAPGASAPASALYPVHCYTTTTPNVGLNGTSVTGIAFMDQVTNISFQGEFDPVPTTSSMGPQAQCPLCPAP